MRKPALPPQLISLVHYVELNKAGWWNKAIQRLITATLWLSGKHLTLNGVVDELKTALGVNLEPGRVRAEVEALSAAGVLVRLPGGQYKISEQALKDLESEVAEGHQLEVRAKERFVQILKQSCPTLEPEQTWKSFNEELLLPLVRGMGAKTYELLSGAAVDLEGTTSLPEFLQKYPLGIRPLLQDAIISFLDPKNPDTRSFLLRYLNAYFLLEASHLSDDTLKALASVTERRPTFTVFLDTNFVFSILGLHENPSNEAAVSLIELIQTLSAQLAIKLYVLPPTVDETRRVLEAYKESFRYLRLTPNLADAAGRTGLNGVAQKFAEESKKAGHPLSAEDYFSPYITGLITIVRAKGVELYNENAERYRTKQEVIDDVMTQLEFEGRRRGARAKTYEQLLHDMVLWHFARTKRPASVESPLEAGYWVVTVDFRFLGFDAFKRTGRGGEIPVCLHPAALIQMLQFFVPRTAQFEEAVLGSLRLPFLFQRFDPSAERITIRILEALSRYENVAELSEETIARILMNEALRQKLSTRRDIKEEIELVREALIEEHEKVRSERESARSEAERLKGEVVQKTRTIAELERQAVEGRYKLEELERHSREERERGEALRRGVEELKRKLEGREEKEFARNERRRFVFRWVIIPGAMVALLVLGSWLFVPRLAGRGLWVAAGVAWGLLLIGWVWLVDHFGLNKPRIREWQVFDRFHRLKKWLFGIVGAAVLGVIGNAAWELLREAWR